jgi:hypothetical protein
MTGPKASQTFSKRSRSSSASLSRSEDARRHALADRLEHRVFLQHLAREVERQVLRIDHAAHEAEPRRQDLRLVGDEHAADVELHPAAAIRVEQVERLHRRDEEQHRIFVAALGAVVDGERRLVELAADMAVELGVLGLGHARLRLPPQRAAVGERLVGDAVAELEEDRHRDMGRIFGDDALDGPARTAWRRRRGAATACRRPPRGSRSMVKVPWPSRQRHASSVRPSAT